MVAMRFPSPRAVSLTVLLGGALLWAYFPAVREMAGKWADDPQYSHGYLVPLFSAFLLWRSRKEFPGGTDRPAWAAGLGLLVAGVGLRLAGSLLYFSWLEMVS